MQFTIEYNSTKYQGVEWIVHGSLDNGDAFCRPATLVEVELWKQYLQMKRKYDEVTQQIKYIGRLRS